MNAKWKLIKANNKSDIKEYILEFNFQFVTQINREESFPE